MSSSPSQPLGIIGKRAFTNDPPQNSHIRLGLILNNTPNPPSNLANKRLLFVTAGTLMLVCLWAMPSLAQQLSIRRYDTSDGLAHGIVTSVYQDKKGYLW